MIKKLVSLSVILALCISLTPVQAIIPGEDAMQPGLEITSTGILYSDIPETLSPTQIEEAGHIARLRDEETGKNTAVFQNADGTNTMYFFAQDIWYENAQGQKMDYSTDIELQQNGTYIGQSNTKTLILPNRVSQGITYSENGYTIQITPSMDTVISNPIVYEDETEPAAEPTEETYECPYSLMNTNSVQAYNPNAVQNIVNGLVLNKPAQLQRNIYAESGREKSTVLYENIYSSDIDIETVPLLHGVRQDIKITDTGRASFSFMINTNGLIPQNSTGYSIALVDNTGKEQIFITSEPIMDESGNISMNNILDIAPCNDGTYLITLTVDQEFVANAISRGEEVYAPLATRQISDYYIYDTYVQQLFPTSNFNSAAVLIDGYFGSGNICRTYIKFLLEGDFIDINPDSITGEALFLTDYSSSYNGTTSMRPYIPDITWDNTTLTWNTAYSGGYDSSRNGVTIPSASTISGTNERHTINLTWGTGEGLLAAFIREDIDPSLNKTLAHNRGIVLINSNESSTSGCRRFCSANSSYGQPYARVTYTTNYGAASFYRSIPATPDINCWGYALEQYESILMLMNYGSDGTLSIDTFIDDVIFYSENNNRCTNMRHIESISDIVSPNEYRVAARYAEKSNVNNGGENREYHFIVQLNDGAWAHKMNEEASQKLTSFSDTNYYWEYIIGYTDSYTNNNHGYSNTIYFAVDPSTR